MSTAKKARLTEARTLVPLLGFTDEKGYPLFRDLFLRIVLQMGVPDIENVLNSSVEARKLSTHELWDALVSSDLYRRTIAPRKEVSIKELKGIYVEMINKMFEPILDNYEMKENALFNEWCGGFKIFTACGIEEIRKSDRVEYKANPQLFLGYESKGWITNRDDIVGITDIGHVGVFSLTELLTLEPTDVYVDAHDDLILDDESHDWKFQVNISGKEGKNGGNFMAYLEDMFHFKFNCVLCPRNKKVKLVEGRTFFSRDITPKLFLDMSAIEKDKLVKFIDKECDSVLKALKEDKGGIYGEAYKNVKNRRVSYEFDAVFTDIKKIYKVSSIVHLVIAFSPQFVDGEATLNIFFVIIVRNFSFHGSKIISEFYDFITTSIIDTEKRLGALNALLNPKLSGGPDKPIYIENMGFVPNSDSVSIRKVTVGEHSKFVLFNEESEKHHCEHIYNSVGDIKNLCCIRNK